MKKSKNYSILSFTCFVIITILLYTNNLSGIDNLLYNNIMSVRSTLLDFFFINITKLCNPLFITIASILLLLILRKDNRMFFGINTILTIITNQVIKRLIRRPRPNHIRLIKEGGFSYPSGHAMISIALYGFLIYLVMKKVKNKYLKISLLTLLIFIILLVGISRVYLGVHYPTDIISGYLLSISIIITVKNYYKKFLGGIKNVKNGFE
ncbi:MAG: phosphatase PAP2 family protein [Bacilli bacterium]|nr:phosphatase PAP2 family protein [Bacilli bacterium]